MLIKCPECKLQVSDKALSCPHCGYPMVESPGRLKLTRRSNKRRRLPNGFGSITEIKNRNLRNPFFTRMCVGKTSVGRPILKSLKPQAYFSTYNEAYEALVQYGKNPYDLEPDITVKELYNKWTDYYFETLKSETSSRTISSAWTYCASVYDMRAKDIRARHIKGCMEDGYRIETRGKNKGEKVYATAGNKGRIKSLFNLMLDYGLEYEIVDRNYARTFDISNDIVEEKERQKRSHIIFSENELKTLWENADKVPYVDLILIQCYTGWRPQELGLIDLGNTNIEEWYFTGGMKTTAGTNRMVPIHSKVQQLVKHRYDEAERIGSNYLFNCMDATKGGYKLTYDKYANRFNAIIAKLELNPEHRAHDPRNTFITRGKKAGISDNAIKKIVGHSSRNDVTEHVYTERDIEWLRKDIEKIT